MKKKKGVCAYSLGGILLIVLVVVLFACGVLSVSLPQCAGKDKNVINAVSTVKNAAPVDGEQANADIITGYFMDIELNGIKTNCYDYPGLSNKGQYGLTAWRTTIDTTVLVTFSDVTYKNKPVFVSEIAPVNFPSKLWKGDNVDIQGDVTVALHESFYNLFTQKFGYFDDEPREIKVRLMVLLGNNGLGLYRRGTKMANVENGTFTVTAKIYKEDVPADVNDPNSPNYRPIGGNGINANPDKDNAVSSVLKKVWNWLVAYWWAILAVGAVVLILGLLIKFFKWVKG